MNKWLLKWGFAITSVILMTGCNSGGSLDPETEEDTVFGPLPSGLPVYVEIVEPVLGNSLKEQNSVALFSHQPKKTASGTAETKEVFNAESDLIVALNTIPDTEGKSDYTLLVKNDTVYSVNHSTNALRYINHFTTQVCEVLPITIVQEDIGAERVLTEIHDERVYVVTADNGEANACADPDSKKRYYELHLDYEQDKSMDDDGEINIISLVSESLARSSLIFGWINDSSQPGKQKIDYGYLGYDSEAKKLEFYNKDREIKWSQSRLLQAFDAYVDAQSVQTPKYMVNIQPLSGPVNGFYLIQLGQDLFIVDGGADLLSKRQSNVDSILNDKIHTLSALTDGDSHYILPANVQANADEVFIFDANRIFKATYQSSSVIRNPSRTTNIAPLHPTSFADKGFKKRQSQFSFSQFDLSSCNSANDNYSDCLDATNVSSQNWQFFTRCEEQYGCIETINVDDYCETLEEKLQTQSDQTLCTPSNYLHLAELNKTTNDAVSLAFMPYDAKGFVRQKQFYLQNDQLFVIARMNHKDVLLTYDYKVGFDQPKSLREQVLFGQRVSLMGMDAYFANNNLYLTALKQTSTRSNECYKFAQRVSCNLGELIENGSSNSCTGKDLVEGLCVNSFKEYESKALFCDSTQIADQTCSDYNLSQLDDLARESADEDAKWLSVFNYVNSSNEMYLLVGNHLEAVTENVLDEGRLYQPSLYTSDSVSGEKNELLSTLDGTVENVVGGWKSKEPESGNSESFGVFSVISDEVKQIGGTTSFDQNAHILQTYVMEQTYENAESTSPSVIKTPKVTQLEF